MGQDEKIIAVTCKTAGSLELEKIQPFQGGLKSRDKKDLDRIKKSLQRYGISFPFFIWDNGGSCFCLDGHGRRMALMELKENGYAIPPVPVVRVEAENEAEAKQKMLRLNSRYGMVTKNSVLQFVTGFDIDIDFGDFAIPGPENMFFDKALKDLDLYFDDIVVGDKDQNKPVKVCPHCGKILP